MKGAKSLIKSSQVLKMKLKIHALSSSISSRVLFDFDQNENYSKIDLCFHHCMATSLDHWVPNFYSTVN